MVKSFLLFMAASMLPGCFCSGPETLYQNDLEAVCGALPCGFTLVNGQASPVVMYHEGEHGIRIERGSSVRLDIDPSTSVPLKPEANLQFIFLCDEGTGFEVVLGSEDESGPTEMSLSGAATPTSPTGEMPVATFPLTLPGPEVSIRPQMRFLQFTTLGPGGCSFDDLWVLVPNRCEG